jgi:hypothetical protein
MPPMYSFLPERDKHMSEQKKSFMQELDEWTNVNIVKRMADAIDDLRQGGDEDSYVAAVDEVKKAVRAKVLESFRNGQKKPGEAAQPPASPQKGARKWK